MSEIVRESTGLTFSADAAGAKPRLRILDQRLLPDHEVWVDVASAGQMEELIKSLAVRGAPLIGVAAALAIVVEGARAPVNLPVALAQLRAARPTAVNLAWALDRMKRAENDPENRLQAALAIFDEDVRMSQQMGETGAPLIADGDSVLTICNTGGLATVGPGTALAVIRHAHASGKRLHVYACETRPLLQGGRLTTWELSRLGIEHTLITDSMAATLMQAGKIQSVFTGADRISRRGDYANKIGTYSLAVLAHFHRLPFYPVAPESTVDFACPDGDAIEVEQRDPREVLGFMHPSRELRWAPEGTKVFNPSFDVTPAELVSRFVLDSGLYSQNEFQAWAKGKS